MTARCLPLIVAATMVAGLYAATPAPYRDGAPPAMTGGFGDETCHSCHFDHEVNRSEGRLAVSGIPGEYVPDSTYSIIVGIARPELGRAGFALAARISKTEPAGQFRADPEMTKLVSGDGRAVYVTHTEDGNAAIGDSASWGVQWTAPDEPLDTVYFNIAANAANGDDSEFGDWIYVYESVSTPILTQTRSE